MATKEERARIRFITNLVKSCVGKLITERESDETHEFLNDLLGQRDELRESCEALIQMHDGDGDMTDDEADVVIMEGRRAIVRATIAGMKS